MKIGRFGTLLKLVFAGAVVVGVGVYFWRIFQDPNLNAEKFVIRWPELVGAAGLYLCAHTLWGTFWWQLLRSQDADIRWSQALRAYFVSQLGKYVPGKVWVIVMRVSMLGGQIPRRTVAVTGIYETLTSMASGSILGAIFFSYLAGGETFLRGGSLALIAVACVPLVAGLLNHTAVRIVRKRFETHSSTFPAPSLWLLALGILQAAIGWCLLAISLRLVIQGTIPEPPEWHRELFFHDLAATTIMYVAGFIVFFAPGGVGARELILQKALVPGLKLISGDAAEGLAAVVAIVLRLVWTLAEILIIAIVWLWGRWHRDRIA
jgi:glycosyltransferase 2 family protein